jgi:hypothetical protein
MGIHAWRYDNAISVDRRLRVPLRDISAALKSIKIEVELGFDPQLGVQGSATLPELRCADGVHTPAVHRVRRLHGHLPDGLHQLHGQRRRGRAAPTPAARRRST